MTDHLYIPQSVLAVAAHPDDLEFTNVGTLALWAQAGARIVYALCTSGDVGIDEPGMTREKATQIREAESREAARIAGAAEVAFLREPDGLLQPTLELRKKLVRLIRQHRPEVVMCGDPIALWSSGDYINHPDHRAAAQAALDAVFPAAGQPHLFQEFEQEGLKAHKVRKVYASTWEGSSTYIDITNTIETKIAALRAHKSQLKDWDPAPMLKEWAADTAKDQGMTYAESYRVITLVKDEDWEKLQAHRAEIKP